MKKCTFLINPKDQSCFIKEKKAQNAISDSSNYHLLWNTIKKEYHIPKVAITITLKNGTRLNTHLEFGVQRVKKYACCCYGMTDQTTCFGLSLLIIFFGLLFLNITVMINQGIVSFATLACVVGSVIALIVAQGLLVLIWYLFNLIRACLIRRALSSLNRESDARGRLKWTRRVSRPVFRSLCRMEL